MMIHKLRASFSGGGAVGHPRGLLAYSRGVGCGLLMHASMSTLTVANAPAQRTSASCSLVSARRFYFAPSRICMNETSSTAGQQQQTPTAGAPAGASSASANGTESALDVAMRVNKMKKAHQSGGANKKEVEQEAWHSLNSLTEDQINNAEGKAVSLLLNAWAYFAKYWAKGKDGPL
ncbi:hypothetical protein, conserved [Leishmania tarentolae]|uniref:RNA-editing substrate-binding complex 7 protein domain-containing protein n=1 Tax=Leishmania tarentolae TaxID=5689 RepID=A0A640KM58_LEITA|nr:hypothetical protein, conserved [Leishmania tarentolae]